MKLKGMLIMINSYNEKHLGNRTELIKKGLCFWVMSGIKWTDNTGQKQSLLLCIVKESKDNLYYCLPVYDYRVKGSKLLYSSGVWMHRNDILSMSYANHIGVMKKTITMANKILSHMVKESDDEDVVKEYNTSYMSDTGKASIANAIIEVENHYHFESSKV